VGIAICFVSWACLLIYRSSVVALDGKRYSALFDDAMTSMRYAWNFSHGSGLVWNPGEYVESYTNPLMTLAMALATSLFDKSGAVLAVQVLGVVLTHSTIAGMMSTPVSERPEAARANRTASLPGPPPTRAGFRSGRPPSPRR